jgi:GTP-binding protein EngB required for normal cell division
VDAEVQKQVLDKCAALHASIMPLNEKLRGPLAKHSDKGTSLPFVFLVGNHSSGKSSFVNYVMGRTIQTAGVAPTDDCFTVIAPGPSDTDQDGPALVGDPDMGFMNLRQFGPTLIHHTQLKVRRDIMTTNFMLVDSPGMIDSPVSSREMDRGYDFKGVVRWFAERADVVLLFFDPDKPGTTGETLSVLLHSLAGMDHKLLIVLNKADQFKKVRVNTCFSKVTFLATTQEKLSLCAHTHTHVSFSLIHFSLSNK